MTAWLGFAVAFAPLLLLALWMALLNRRDRRRDALEATVGACCAELGLRGAFAVHACVGTLVGDARVVLDMRLCATAEVWQTLERLPSRLPPRARLVIVATGCSPSRRLGADSERGGGDVVAARAALRAAGSRPFAPRSAHSARVGDGARS